MTIRRFHRQRNSLFGVAPVGLLAAAMIAGTAASPVPADPRPVAASRPASGYAWSLVQVRQLIVAIEGTPRLGLDPADYGLAALRAELELCERLWNTPGSRQLDTLARTSALALAADYRRHSANAAPVRPVELDAALGAGRVGSWLAAQAPAPAPGGIS